jgi:hypothetical protein
MLRRNSFWLGLLIGLVFPSILFGILYSLNYYTKLFDHPPVILSIQKMMFVSSALNILPIRYYFKHADFEKTGQGILFITVFLVVMIILAF